MLGWVGKLIGGATDLGGQWLRNRGRVADASAGYQLAQLQAKTGLAVREAEMELEARRATSDLDRMAVEQGGNSIWDEALCILFLSPVGFIVYGTITEAPTHLWASSILTTLENLPTWYLVVVGLIFVRYLGFRSLLRLGLRIWGKRIFDLDFRTEDGKNGVRGTPKTN